MNEITCPKCGNYVPGHATGAADICTCEPITVSNAHMESALRERDEARDALEHAEAQHEYYRGKVSEFMGANQALAAALAQAKTEAKHFRDALEEIAKGVWSEGPSYVSIARAALDVTFSSASPGPVLKIKK